MEITLTRIYTCPTYTIGRIRVDNRYICDTIEDTDRGLDDTWPLSKIKAKKVKFETAIPTGKYRITMDVQSPKFSQKYYYKTFCNGYMPRLIGVKGFDGILIHRGSTAASSAGCIIVGYNTEVGKVANSKYAFEELYGLLKAASKRGEKITIEIMRNYVIKE